MGVALFAAGIAIWQYLTFREEEPVTAASIAASWNSSIAKLGITPVFPPEEDLHVGDVWAVIEDADESQAILGKAVRIAHISLREDLKREANLKRPTFSRTVELENGKKIRKQSNYEVDAGDVSDKIKLSLALFPGITINKSVKASSLIDSVGLTFGLSSGRNDAEEIKIPISETYGVSAGIAAARLDIWCKDPPTQLYCRDEFLRRVMAFAVNERVLATKDGAYTAKIQLRLVNRVFMTREIEHRKTRDFALGASARAAVPPAEAEPVGAGAASSSEARIKSLEDRVSALLSGGPGGTYSRADSNEFALKQLLERPVVFGFRAVSTSIVPSTPGEGRK
ncbi:hypothetical protein AB4Z10_06775 [Bosea sp. RAF48]|uniref:hypothetical protein n=1 Tax=Bosea sp. RAF48 TaxID=3237480 RepID=UPI003F91170D